MRTFIAIMLPERLKRVVASRQAALMSLLEQNQLHKAIRWTAPDDMHLTLRFLGETTEGQRLTLRDKFVAASDAWSPFVLSLGPYGCFPHYRRPSVLWLGIGGEIPVLTALQAEIEQIVQQAGFEAEKRGFRPHLTIGRADRRSATAQLSQVGAIVQSVPQSEISLGSIETSEFIVTEIVHMRSQLRPSGALYSAVEVFALSTASSGS